jgi:DNA topoisomerase-1
MARPGLARRKVLATVVHLLETTHIRVGNEDYAKENHSYGLTTLRNPHVKVNGTELRFNFKGKGGKVWRLQIKDRRVAKVIRACQDLPGQQLFQYYDEAGDVQDVTSSDVNDYLREITGKEITAKDFRTWAGTLLAAAALREFEATDSDAKTKKMVKAAIEQVAARLGNTVTICRKCYVHPEIISAYLTGTLAEALQKDTRAGLRDQPEGLSPDEAAVLLLLEKRIKAGNPLHEAVEKLGLKPKRRSRKATGT